VEGERPDTENDGGVIDCGRGIDDEGNDSENGNADVTGDEGNDSEGEDSGCLSGEVTEVPILIERTGQRKY
jgi:hypothetical protein